MILCLTLIQFIANDSQVGLCGDRWSNRACSLIFLSGQEGCGILGHLSPQIRAPQLSGLVPSSTKGSGGGLKHHPVFLPALS